MHGTAGLDEDIVELVVKSRATEREADMSWIDAQYQIADCLTTHAARKSEDVLQHLIHQAQRRITGEETMLETRRGERERPRRGFVSKRLVAKYAEATLCWRNASTGVRTTSLSVTHK